MFLLTLFQTIIKVANTIFLVGVTEIVLGFKIRESFHNFYYLVIDVTNRPAFGIWGNGKAVFSSEQISGLIHKYLDEVHEDTAKCPDVGSLSILLMECYDFWGTVES